ncbi:MAG: PIN domain-containing protein [Anaerolineae bacterium]|nr:PIN domain-containing protein [Anaerolineae bacterium]
MPLNNILVDSSYLYAVLDEKNDKHEIATAVSELYRGQFIVPYVVLTEVAYLFNRESGVHAVLKFLDKLRTMQPILEPVTYDDLDRVREIMASYQDARFDFVDCCIMAISERLRCTEVCTFDRRDFSIFRPKHVSHLELLP